MVGNVICPNAVERRAHADLLPEAIENGIDLIRVDPARNMYRYYQFRYEKDLFGQWFLVREWGRIGKSRQAMALAVSGRREAVREALATALQKLRRGYRLRVGA